ncbi:MAG: hypothetical protein AB7I27_05715 [Bacteriovoracaceae bacterium]
MLRFVRRKLCPFISLALAIGCGKKIADTNGSMTRSSETQQRSSTWVLRLDTSFGISKIFDVPQNGVTQIPENLKVQNNGQGKQVKITYKFDSRFPEDFALACLYKSINDPTLLSLVNCKNSDGADVGDVSTFELALYYTQQIKMELVGSSTTGLVIDSHYSVDWK